jgi:hypothetical protein
VKDSCCPNRATRSIRKNWDEIRAQGHRTLDDMLDYAADIRDRPVWSPIPDEVCARAAIVNHRTDTCDIDALISAVLEFGAQRSGSGDGLIPEVGQSPPLAM